MSVSKDQLACYVNHGCFPLSNNFWKKQVSKIFLMKNHLCNIVATTIEMG